jgi:hypothetical protein
LFKGLDNEDSDIVDNASRHVHSILRSTLNSSIKGWKLLNMLKKMNETDPGFTYRVIRDDNGAPTGVVWMTPHMRANFELYGNFVSIDAMKRQQNALDWPYIGPVVLDDNKTVAVIAESIICAERLDAYNFVLQSIFEMAPNRSKSEVKVIASDCFVTTSLLEMLGIGQSCHLMWDHYHILEVVWPKQLGNHYFTMVRPLLQTWLSSSSAEAFDATLAEIVTVLAERPDHVSYIQKWGEDRHRFAAYLLDSYPGSLNRRGSSPSEQNHASFVAIIGAGAVDNPCVMLEKTIGRQVELNRKRNETIATYFYKSISDRQTAIASGDQTKADALEHLCSWGMEIWTKNYSEALNYVCSLNDEVFTVQRINSNANPRLVPMHGRCTCNTRVSLMFPCPHEICIDNLLFVINRVEKRWHKRSSISASYAVEVIAEGNNANDGDNGNDFEDSYFDATQRDTQDENMIPRPSQAVLTQQSQSTGLRKTGFNYLMSLTQEVAQYGAGHKLEQVVAGMLIQLGGFLKGTHDVNLEDGASQQSMLDKFSAIADTYNNAFGGRRVLAETSVSDVENISPVAPPAAAGRVRTARYKPIVEKLAAKANFKRKRSCGFCKSTEHGRQTYCPVMFALGKKIENVSKFHAYLMENAPFLPWGGGDKLVLKALPKEAKHVVVHFLYSTFMGPKSTRPQYECTVIEATLIGKHGIALPSYKSVCFEGPVIFQFLGSLVTMQNRHVFSTVDDPNQNPRDNPPTQEAM